MLGEDKRLQSTYDVVVVGGGPAGLSCARTLVDNNSDLSVLLIERARYPRDKVCGDGFTARALELMAEIFPESAAWAEQAPELSRCAFVYPNGVELRAKLSLRVLPRRDVDGRLRETLAGRRCQVLEGARVTRLLRDGERVVGVEVQPEEGAPVQVRASWVVGADGSRSRIRRDTGSLDGDRMNVGVRQYVRGISPEHTVATALIDLEGQGYFWFFPFFRNQEWWANIGWWQFGQSRVNPRRRLLSWLENQRIRDLLAGGSRVGEVRGCPINVARIRGPGRVGLARRAWGPGYLLVGDAAGLAHPLTGGGIELALFSGRCAGLLIAKGSPIGELGRAYERESVEFAHSNYGLFTSQLMLSMPCHLPAPLSAIYLRTLKSFFDRSGHLGRVLHT